MYYPCSENKDADQLRGFCPCKLLVFSRTGSHVISVTSQTLFPSLHYDVINIPPCKFVCFSLTRIIKYFIHHNQKLLGTQFNIFS